MMRHPFRNDKWILVLLCGLFLFIVLFFYKGFNIQQGESFSGHGLLSRSLIFGLATSLAFGINEFLIAPRIGTISWIRTVLWHLWEVFFGGTLVFLVFNYFWKGTEFNWYSYFLLISEYLLVMIIPISIYYLLRRKPSKTRNVEHYVTFSSLNKKEQVKLLKNNILYLKSEDNYIEIFHMSDSGVKSNVLRNTLKNIEVAMTPYSGLQRCHRSYMVNLKKIKKVHYKKRKLVLTLAENIEIPVSEKYRLRFNEMLDVKPPHM